MADAIHYLIVLGIIVMAAISAWAVLTPNHLYVG